MSTMTLGEMVTTARKRLGMTQADLGKALGGRSRQWVAQLEGGRRYDDRDRPFEASPDMYVKIATTLNLPVVDVLKAAGVPEREWPNLSHVRSIDASVRTIDITTLTTEQTRLVEELVTLFKAENNANDEGNH